MVYSLPIITTLYHYERSTPCRNFLKNLTKLARNLLSKLCAELVDYLKKIIFSHEFLAKNRQSDKDFLRQRKLPFHLLIVFLINFVKGSYQDELDKFFKTFYRFDVARRVVSKVALSKARMKLKFKAFIELNDHLIDFFEKHFQPRSWCGFRLLAIDGSLTRLPANNDIAEHFGTWNGRQGAPSPMARISQLFDVLNKINIDAIIHPKGSGERELAARHMLKIMPTDLILLDRGYPAWWLFNLILSLDANFCARISTKWKVVRKFFKSDRDEKIISVPIHATSVAACREMGLDMKPLKLRLIRIKKEDNTLILITSLIDTEKYPIELFYDLYHYRWPIEEDYKTVKCRMELENFTGKSPLSVYQDFHAKVFAKNLVSVMAYPLKEPIEKDSQTRKYSHQINFTQALSKCKGPLALLFLETTKKIRAMIEDLQEIFQRTTEPIRPGRKYPRKHKAKSRRFFPAYKPIG